MYDDVLGLFYADVDCERYTKTHSWLGKTIYLSFTVRENGDAEKCIAILRELCANQTHWENACVDYLMETLYNESYQYGPVKREDLRLVEINACIEGDSDFEFTYYYGAGIGVDYLEGSLKEGIIGITGGDLWWRGGLIYGLLDGKTKPDMEITETSTNPYPYYE